VATKGRLYAFGIKGTSGCKGSGKASNKSESVVASRR
jgi:hypothetical protein